MWITLMWMGAVVFGWVASFGIGVWVGVKRERKAWHKHRVAREAAIRDLWNGQLSRWREQNRQGHTGACEMFECNEPLDALPIIPITDESIAMHGEDEVFWLVYDPDPCRWDLSDEDEPIGWVCMGSWLKEAE